MELDSKGFIGTVVFHSFLLLLIIFFSFKTPLPLPAEEGMMINFGDMDFGLGESEPKFNDKELIKEQQQAQNQASPVTEKDAVMTQEFEEAPVAVEKKKSEKKTESETKKITPVVSDNQKSAEKTVTKEQEVNTKALYKGRKTDTDYSGSEGVTTGKGNQGSLSGSENATDHSLGSSSGDGVSFSLSGRNPLSLDKPNIDYQKEGRVVVQVKVDRSGVVVEAVPGVKGSTTLDSYLLGVAKKAAIASRFDNKPDAPYYQTGTITYVFKLK